MLLLHFFYVLHSSLIFSTVEIRSHISKSSCYKKFLLAWTFPLGTDFFCPVKSEISSFFNIEAPKTTAKIICNPAKPRNYWMPTIIQTYEYLRNIFNPFHCLAQGEQNPQNGCSILKCNILCKPITLDSQFFQQQ